MNTCESKSLCKNLWRESNQSNFKIQETSSEFACATCTELITELIKDVENNRTEAYLVEKVDKLCREIPNKTFMDTCLALSNLYLATVIEMLADGISPKVVCKSLGVCSGPAYVPKNISEIVTVHEKYRQNAQMSIAEALTPVDNRCTDCEFFFSWLAHELPNNATRAEFETTLLEFICPSMPTAVGITCEQLIPYYAYNFYTLYYENMDVRSKCAVLGLCPGSMMQLMTLAARRYSKMPGYTCKDCLRTAGLALKYPAKSNDAKYIRQLLCQTAARTDKKCKDAVLLYGDSLEGLLRVSEKPAEFCRSFSNCSEADLRRQPAVPKLSLPHHFGGLFLHRHFSMSACKLCTNFIKQLEGYVQVNRSEEAIVQAMDYICSLLGPEKDRCQSLVDKYGPQIMKLIMDDVLPETICETLGLCFLPFNARPLEQFFMSLTPRLQRPKSIECELCKKMAHRMLDQLANNQSLEKIEEDILQVCAEVHDPQMCADFVKTHLQPIVDRLLSKWTAEEVCREFGMCAMFAYSRSTEIVCDARSCRSQTSVWTDHNTTCLRCKSLTRQAYSLLSLGHPRVEIDHILAANCNKSHQVAACHAWLQRRLDFVLQSAQRNTPQAEVCDVLHSCVNRSADHYKCSWGPTFWCSSFDTALDCNATHYCETEVWSGERAARQACNTCATVARVVRHLQLGGHQYEAIVERLRSDFCGFAAGAGDLQNCSGSIESYVNSIWNRMHNDSRISEEALCQQLEMCPQHSQNSSLTSQVEVVNRCNWGPAYWCHNAENAEECGARSYCQKSVWKSDDKNVCLYCKIFVMKTYFLLAIGKSKDDIVVFWTDKCQKCSVPDKCKLWVDNHLDDIITGYHNKACPQKLCESFDACAPRQAVFSSRCHLGPRFWCASQDNAQQCEAEHHCQAEVWSQTVDNNNNSNSVDAEFETIRPAELCFFCKSLVQRAMDFVEHNQTLEEIRTELGFLCSQTAAPRTCAAWVNSSLLGDIQSLEAGPSSVSAMCARVGFCAAGQNRSQSLCSTGPTYWCLSELAARQCGAVDYCRRVGGKLSPPSPGCQACGRVVEFVGDKANRTEASELRVQAEETFAGVEPVEIYKNLTGHHLTDIISRSQLGQSNVTQCGELGYCDWTPTADPMCLIGPSYWCSSVDRATQCRALAFCRANNRTTSGVRDNCAVCKMLVDQIFALVKQNKTEEEIAETLETLCQFCPQTDACRGMVEKYTRIIVEFLTSEISPEQVCQELGLCASAVLLSGAGQACSRGPAHWCSSLEAAQLCHAQDYCRKLGWPAHNSAQFSRSQCVQGPGYWCQSNTTARHCQAEQFCRRHVWKSGGGGSGGPAQRHHSPNLLGSRHCTRGPSYWCDSLQRAKLCDAEAYCQERFWNRGEHQELGLGASNCSRGPAYWCKSEETARECDTVDHCRNQSANNSPPALIGANRCTWGPAYWCRSALTAQECSAEQHCQLKVWRGAAAPQNAGNATDESQLVSDRPTAVRRLLGAKKCTWGPSYWCHSAATAEECGAQQHCRLHVWKAAGPPTSTNDSEPVLATPTHSLLGANKCSRGPAYWCSSPAAANQCNATEHCVKNGAGFPRRVRPLGLNKCTWGPAYFCRSAEAAEECGTVEECRRYRFSFHHRGGVGGGNRLGQLACSWGPSFWCSSIENAEKCGAVDHCRRFYADRLRE